MGSTGTLNRLLNVSVEGYVKSTSEFDDKIDDICKEVETAMAGDQTINGLAKNSFLSSTEINYSGEGEQPIGVVTLNYVVQYRTATNAPDVAV
jgi:phage terminase large subunit-like protein